LPPGRKTGIIRGLLNNPERGKVKLKVRGIKEQNKKISLLSVF